MTTLDTTSPSAVPYFNWDAPVTNAEIREALACGGEEDRIFWIARIMSEARYEDVWRYLSLRRDVLPLWERVRPHLGRKRELWEFLIEGWRSDGLV